MNYNSQQKLKDNIAAIRIALEWKEGQMLLPAAVEALKRYAGFGGLKAVLYPNSTKEEWIKLKASKEDLRLYPQITGLHQLLQQHFKAAEYKQVIDSIKNSILTAYYTPEIVPQTLFNALKQQGIEPQNMYEPSSGAGVFVSEAAQAFPSLQNITAVEKDILSGRVLTALISSIPVPVSVQVKSFENTSNDENGKYDLIVSNIPFGSFRVFDESFNDESLTGKIHNYFFAKGLDKLKDGGLLAYITTDAFLNSPSNQKAREYLFDHADFISLHVMPDNLMKDTGNTEAPSHLLIVQKNVSKQMLSDNDLLLINTAEQENDFGKFHINQYIIKHPEIIIGDKITAGKNQYGRATQSVWQSEDINAIKIPLAETLATGLKNNFNKEAFGTKVIEENISSGKRLTYLTMPENKADNSSVQLGLFDTAPAANTNRASAYINRLDATVIDRKTARIANIIRTSDKPGHEAFVLVTAKAIAFKQYVYKLYSNTDEVQFPANWMNASAIHLELNGLANKLQEYNHQFHNEGEGVFHVAINNKDGELDELKELNPYHKEGTLIVHNDRVGFVSYIAGENDKPVFLPSLYEKKDVGFYQQYIAVRDEYLTLSDKESNENIEYPELRKQLNESYDALVKGFGILNSTTNKQRILKDEAFGFIVLASLERKEGDQYFKADILTRSLIQKQEAFHTDNPVEALAKSLNDKGFVDIEFIAAATDSTEPDTIQALGNHIYINPANNQWETADQLLSGNVVAKLNIAKVAAGKEPDNFHLQRSLVALEKIQPEKIPFELLDFNLGERWIPQDFYNRFATHLFELDTTVNYFPSIDWKIRPY